MIHYLIQVNAKILVHLEETFLVNIYGNPGSILRNFGCPRLPQRKIVVALSEVLKNDLTKPPPPPPP